MHAMLTGKHGTARSHQLQSACECHGLLHSSGEFNRVVRGRPCMSHEAAVNRRQSGDITGLWSGRSYIVTMYVPNTVQCLRDNKQEVAACSAGSLEINVLHAQMTTRITRRSCSAFFDLKLCSVTLISLSTWLPPSLFHWHQS